MLDCLKCQHHWGDNYWQFSSHGYSRRRWRDQDHSLHSRCNRSINRSDADHNAQQWKFYHFCIGDSPDSNFWSLDLLHDRRVSPTQSSTLYAGAMTLTSSAVVKAKAFKSGYTASAEA